MKIIRQENFSYVLFEEDGKIYLNVLCGGAAMYDITIELSPEEAKSCQTSQNKLEKLVGEISYSPEKYKARWECKRFTFPKA
jgi:hypothetical protein